MYLISQNYVLLQFTATFLMVVRGVFCRIPEGVVQNKRLPRSNPDTQLKRFPLKF